jgi:PAS domain S-box-containing protein
MVEIVSIIYTVANFSIAVLLFIKSRANLLSKFYLFIIGCMVTLGAITIMLTQPMNLRLLGILEMVGVFIYSLLPFFFIHFIILFVRRYEIFKVKYVIPALYFVGLFCYLTILLELIPKPISISKEISPSAYTYYLTWMTIFFAIGVAMVYEVARGFYEKPGRSHILLASFLILLLILPGPFTESVFFKILRLNSIWYYFSSTLSVTIAVFFIFRHKIIVNTLYDAMKSTLAVLNDLLITTNEQFQIEMVWGATTTKLLSYKEGELFGKSLYDLIVQKEYLDRYSEFVSLKKMKESYFDADIVCKNGDSIPMNISLSPIILNEVVSGFVCLGRDIRERKKLEEELRQAQKLESLGTLAGGIAHDFNNILQIIQLNNSVLKKNNLQLEKVAKSVELNDRAVQRGASLVKQLLTFARKGDVQFEVVDINEILKDLVKMLSETFPKTISFELSLDPKLCLLTADPNQLHQVLLNLAINSRDAMPNGGTISISTKTIEGENIQKQFKNAYDKQYVCIVFSDNGYGMDESTSKHVFEPFFTTKEKGKGTGLGLPVVYGIINSHHGFIDFESKPFEGTTFSIYLPTTITKKYLKKPEKELAKMGLSGSETILVVEDEENIMNSLYTLFTENGYNVMSALNGEEAVNLYKLHNERIHLILTDLGLPKLGGWDAFLQMKKINPKVKVIIASGYLDPQIKSEKTEVGVAGFLTKPYQPDILLKTVRMALDTEKVLGSTN